MPRTYAQEREHKWRLRGILDTTFEEYEEMRRMQHEKCGICGSHINGNSALDHDHMTGKVRGILCHNCNMSLGHLEQYILSGHVNAYLQLSGKEQQ